VFENSEDAKKREAYVGALTEGGGPFGEYHWLDGLVFLRVSYDLTPQQARDYEDALHEIVK
jgi:hypothetical protein